MCVCVCVYVCFNRQMCEGTWKWIRHDTNLSVCATWAHHAPPENFEEMMHFAAFKTNVYVNQILDIYE